MDKFLYILIFFNANILQDTITHEMIDTSKNSNFAFSIIFFQNETKNSLFCEKSRIILSRKIDFGKIISIHKPCVKNILPCQKKQIKVNTPYVREVRNAILLCS
jgi:hypothetical protein